MVPRIVLIINYDTRPMSHTNNKEVQEIMLGLSTSNKCHLIDGKFYYLESDVKDTLHQELQKAREEEREETREILRCISRMVEINATNLENYILGQMPIVQSELDQPNN